jgi:methylamine---glutamate N-methyltransferase subunit B
MEPVTLSCAELSTREINATLAALPDGACARVLEPRGGHNLAVGLASRVTIDIEGNRHLPKSAPRAYPRLIVS